MPETVKPEQTDLEEQMRWFISAKERIRELRARIKVDMTEIDFLLDRLKKMGLEE